SAGMTQPACQGPLLTLALTKCTFGWYKLYIKTMARTNSIRGTVVSALQARANFAELLRRVDQERRSIVIEKRGTPRAVLLSIRDYIRLASPEPEVLQAIGAESHRKGTDALTSAQIDRIIKAARSKKLRRCCSHSGWFWTPMSSFPRP